jgi:hypothetical protein
VNTENEKAVRDPMREAFEKWWRDSGGGPVSMKVNARHTWQNAWQAALQSQVSNTPQDDPLSGWLVTEISAIDCEYRGDPSYTHDAYWMREAVIGFIEKHKSVIDVTPPQQQEQSGEAVRETERLALAGALERLVELKDYKDAHGKDDHYEREQPEAWQQARDVLNTLEEPSPATPTATASQESTPTSDQTGREPT